MDPTSNAPILKLILLNQSLITKDECESILVTGSGPAGGGYPGAPGGGYPGGQPVGHNPYQQGAPAGGPAGYGAAPPGGPAGYGGAPPGGPAGM